MYIYIIMEFDPIFTSTKTLKIIKNLTSDQILDLIVEDAHRLCDVDRCVKSRLTFLVEGHSEVSDTSAACRGEKNRILSSVQQSWKSSLSV